MAHQELLEQAAHQVQAALKEQAAQVV
jgi:hypothetical protein